MDSVITNITTNYIWYLIGFVVITMVIIGYFADKTDFGHKKQPKEQEPTPEDEIDVDKLKNKKIGDAILNNKENKVVEDLSAPLTDNVVNTDNMPITNINEDLNAPFGDQEVINDNNKIPDDIMKPLVNEEVVTKPVLGLNEDLNVPFGDNDKKSKGKHKREPKNISSDDEIDNSPIEEIVEPVVIDDKNEASKDTNIPEIATVDNENKVVEELPQLNIDNNVVEKVEEPESNIDSNEISIPDLTNSVTSPEASTSVTEHPDIFNSPLPDIEDGTINTPIVKYNKIDNTYESPVVPEVIMDELKKDKKQDIKSDDDIWKF